MEYRAMAIKKTIEFGLLALCFLSSPLRAQADVQSAQREVDRLCAEKRWQEALTSLAEALHECRSAASPESCKATIGFLTAYCHQQWAAADSSLARAQLQQALGIYRELEGKPVPQARVYFNRALAYRQLGEAGEAIRSLQRAQELDPGNGTKYLLAEAETQLQFGNENEALRSYQALWKEDPSLDLSVHEIVRLLSMNESRSGELIAFAENLRREGKYSLAAEAYLDLLQGHANVNRDDIFVNWVESATLAGTLTPLALKDLAGAIPDTTLRPLQALFAKPPIGLKPNLWWNQTSMRRHVWSGVLAKLAMTAEAAGHEQAATHLLETALESAPRFYQYSNPQLRERENLPMEIALKLAVRYARRGPPNKLHALEAEFFNEKAVAYQSEDLEAIQRYHTILGLTYFELKRYSGTGYDNAIFQLGRALETADRRVKKDPGVYRPLPHLSERLGKSYEATGSKTKANAPFLDAAEGYLDLDALTEASVMMKRLDPGITGRDATRRHGIAEILRTRQLIANADTVLWAIDDKGNVRVPAEQQWLMEKKPSELRPEFVDRQRFKAFADLGERWRLEGQTRQSAYARSRALEAAHDVRALGGPGDAVRIQRIEAGVDRVAKAGPLLDKSESQRSPEWGIAGGGGATQFRAQPDLLRRTQVAEALSKIAPGIETRAEIRIEGGEVSFTPRPGQAVTAIEEQRMREALRKVPGVTTVRRRGPG